MKEKETYSYYPLENYAKYLKCLHEHEFDMAYRYGGGKQIYTLKEIIELRETDKIIHNSLILKSVEEVAEIWRDAVHKPC